MDQALYIELVLALSKKLQELDSDHEALVLKTYGISSRPDELWGPRPSIIEWLMNNASENQILEIALYFDIDQASGTNQHAHNSVQPLKLFGSHLSDFRNFVGAVATELKFFGVDLFVAHDTIPMDALWEQEIAESLKTCHAGVTFHHQGFSQSYYCMQEVGWLIGRDLPIARLIFNENPLGLLASRHGRNVANQQCRYVVGALLDWISSISELQVPFSESLSEAFLNSTSFSRTDQVWRYLSNIERISDNQIGKVLEAGAINDQVFSTGIGNYSGTPYRNAIIEKVKSWDVQGIFAEHISILEKADPGKPANLPGTVT